MSGGYRNDRSGVLAYTSGNGEVRLNTCALEAVHTTILDIIWHNRLSLCLFAALCGIEYIHKGCSLTFGGGLQQPGGVVVGAQL